MMKVSIEKEANSAIKAALHRDLWPRRSNDQPDNVLYMGWKYMD